MVLQHPRWDMCRAGRYYASVYDEKGGHSVYCAVEYSVCEGGGCSV